MQQPVFLTYQSECSYSAAGASAAGAPAAGAVSSGLVIKPSVRRGAQA